MTTAIVASATIHDLPALVVDDLVFTIAPPADRTTIEIVVERDASLVLKAPHGVTVERAARFVSAKRRWVHRKLAEKDALAGPPVVKRFVEGEGFAYLGRSHRLTLVEQPGDYGCDGGHPVRQTRPGGPVKPAESSEVRLERGRFHMSASVTAARGAEAMRHWYTAVGGRWVRRRVGPWAARLGEGPVQVAVRDLGYRWGSARPTDGPQRVNVHWAALQLPPSLIDYVLVHELAHLREAAHGAAFWAIVDRLMPGYETPRANLATAGRNVWLGAVAAPAAVAGGGLSPASGR